MKIFERVLLGLLFITALLGLTFIVGAETPLGPAPEALSALQSDSQVIVAMGDFIVMDGGNHAQFGDYGSQPGDNAATISRVEQQTQIVNATVKFLEELAK
jgi:hypothetical protein